MTAPPLSWLFTKASRATRSLIAAPHRARGGASARLVRAPTPIPTVQGAKVFPKRSAAAALIGLRCAPPLIQNGSEARGQGLGSFIQGRDRASLRQIAAFAAFTLLPAARLYRVLGWPTPPAASPPTAGARAPAAASMAAPPHTRLPDATRVTAREDTALRRNNAALTLTPAAVSCITTPDVRAPRAKTSRVARRLAAAIAPSPTGPRPPREAADDLPAVRRVERISLTGPI